MKKIITILLLFVTASLFVANAQSNRPHDGSYYPKEKTQIKFPEHYFSTYRLKYGVSVTAGVYNKGNWSVDPESWVMGVDFTVMGFMLGFQANAKVNDGFMNFYAGYWIPFLATKDVTMFVSPIVGITTYNFETNHNEPVYGGSISINTGIVGVSFYATTYSFSIGLSISFI